MWLELQVDLSFNCEVIFHFCVFIFMARLSLDFEVNYQFYIVGFVARFVFGFIIFLKFVKSIIFFSTLWCSFFWHKYILTSHHINFLKCSSLAFDIFECWPTTICKNVVNFFHNNDVVENWNMVTLKNRTNCDNNLGTLNLAL
jgi:hypothetical protein